MPENHSFLSSLQHKENDAKVALFLSLSMSSHDAKKKQLLLSSLGHPSSKIGDYIGPLICFAGLGRG